MKNKSETCRYFLDHEKLPTLFPTHRHSPLFWEQLGRTIATFGFLEEILGRAIFAFSVPRRCAPEEEEAAYKAWCPKLEKALTDQLWHLADSYGKAVRENQDSTIENIEELVNDIKKSKEIRNVLCHGSWQIPDADGKSLPLFFKNEKGKEMEKFETPIDVNFLQQVQTHTASLACDVMNTVTQMGWHFPGSARPGKKLFP